MACEPSQNNPVYVGRKARIFPICEQRLEGGTAKHDRRPRNRGHDCFEIRGGQAFERQLHNALLSTDRVVNANALTEELNAYTAAGFRCLDIGCGNPSLGSIRSVTDKNVALTARPW